MSPIGRIGAGRPARRAVVLVLGAASLGLSAVVCLLLVERARTRTLVADQAGAVTAALSERDRLAEALDARTTERDRLLSERDAARLVGDFFRIDVVAVHARRSDEDGRAMRRALDRAAEGLPPAIAKDPALEAAVRFHLGATYAVLDDPKAAAEALARAVALNAGRFGDGDPRTIAALQALGRAELAAGSVGAARATLERAARALANVPAQQVAEHAAEHAAERRSTALALAAVCLRDGDPQAAERIAREARALHRAEVGDDDVGTRQATGQLARALVEQGRALDAIEPADACVAFDERVHGPAHPATFASKSLRARIAAELGDHARAAAILAAIVERATATLGEDDPDTQRWSIQLATALDAAGRFEDAEALLRRRAAFTAAKQPGSPAEAAAAERLGGFLERRGRPADAAIWLARARELRRTGQGAIHPDAIALGRRLAEAQSDAGDDAAAIALLENDANRMLLATDADPTERTETIAALVRLLERADRHDAARMWSAYLP
jgi:tetratricopeptide (TPR) repeat protein